MAAEKRFHFFTLPRWMCSGMGVCAAHAFLLEFRLFTSSETEIPMSVKDPPSGNKLVKVLLAVKAFYEWENP